MCIYSNHSALKKELFKTRTTFLFFLLMYLEKPNVTE